MGKELPQLHIAAREGNSARLKELLDEGGEPSPSIDEKDHLQRTALHLAAWAGQESCVRLLLEKGAQHSALAVDNITPLLFAAQKGHEDVVVALASAGADVNAVDSKRKRSALHVASAAGNECMVKLLVELQADAQLRDKNNKIAGDLTENSKIKRLLPRSKSTLRKQRQERLQAAVGADEGDDGQEDSSGDENTHDTQPSFKKQRTEN